MIVHLEILRSRLKVFSFHLLRWKLKTLDIDFYDFSVDDAIKLVCTLKDLENLTITFQDEFKHTERFLRYVSCNLINLLFLSFEGDNGPFNFDFIGALPNLEELCISNFSNVAGSRFDNLTKLKKLIFFDCYLEDDFLIELLRCAPNLEYLCITDCPKITNTVIDVAIEVTKHRTNNVMLTIDRQGTKISFDKIVEISPWLHLL